MQQGVEPNVSDQPKSIILWSKVVPAAIANERNKLLDDIADFLWDAEDFAYYDGDNARVKSRELVAAFNVRFPKAQEPPPQENLLLNDILDFIKELDEVDGKVTISTLVETLKLRYQKLSS